MDFAGPPPGGTVHIEFRHLVSACRIQSVQAEGMGADGAVLILGAVRKDNRTALILRHIHQSIIIPVIG